MTFFNNFLFILEKALDHVWVGGHTKKIGNDWKWVDEKNNILSRKGIGISSSWCLQSDKSGSLLKADPETCLNLDREGHGLPLFYGLPCDIIQQHVLCNIPINSTEISPQKNEDTDSFSSQEDVDSLEDNKEEIAPRFLMPETTDNIINSNFNFQPEVNKNSMEERNESTTIIYKEDITTIESTLSNDFNNNVKYLIPEEEIEETTINSETSTLKSKIESEI